MFCPLSDLLFLLLMPYVAFQKIIVVLKVSSSKIDFLVYILILTRTNLCARHSWNMGW